MFANGLTDASPTQSTKALEAIHAAAAARVPMQSLQGSLEFSRIDDSSLVQAPSDYHLAGSRLQSKDKTFAANGYEFSERVDAISDSRCREMIDVNRSSNGGLAIDE
jgi:hypothetical protein